MYKLEWDSNFWNLDIYNVDEKDFSECFENTAPKNCLIQALLHEEESDKINYLEDNEFRFIGSKITLTKKIIGTYFEPENYKKIKKYEIDLKKDSFYELYGEFTRFKMFDQEKVNNYYYTWVINSIDGKMDDTCIGYYLDNKLAGFISYKFKPQNLVIGLIGVFPEFRKRNISQNLLNYAANDALKNGYSEIIISTQGANTNAINAYVKNGFRIESIYHWYYLKKDFKFNNTL